MKNLSLAFVFLLLLAPPVNGQGAPATLDANEIDLSGHLSEERAELTISANLLNRFQNEEKLLYTTEIRDNFAIAITEIRQRSELQFERVQGQFKTISVGFTGDTLPQKVTGEHLASWSIRYPSATNRSLVLEFSKEGYDANTVTITIEMATRTIEAPLEFSPTSWQLPYPSLGTGTITATTAPSLALSILKLDGLVEQPASVTINDAPDHESRFRFQGTPYSAAFEISTVNPDDRRILLSEMKLKGHYSVSAFSFIVDGTAQTKNPKGASITLLDGEAALTQYTAPEGATILFLDGAYVLKIDGPGSYPINYQFEAKIQSSGTQKQTDFELPPANLFPISLTDLPLETKIQLKGSGPLNPPEGTPFEVSFPRTVKFEWSGNKSKKSNPLDSFSIPKHIHKFELALGSCAKTRPSN
jgi:hypothetical protein